MDTNTDKMPTSPGQGGTSRAKKEKIVAKLSEKITRAKGMVFTNYQGLTHLQLEKLKKAVKPFDADLVATKNTLLFRSLKISNFNPTTGSGQAFQISNFRNATATLFLYGDPVGPLKEIAKSIKELSLPSIKFGILEGIELTSDQVLKLSTLPPKEALLTQLVFGLKSPISGLHRALNWNIQKFVMTLKSIEAKKS